MRPIRESDAPALVALHGRLSDESVYLRYFSPHARLSRARGRARDAASTIAIARRSWCSIATR